MEDDAWWSVDGIPNEEGVPNVLQQRVKVYSQEMDAEGAGYIEPVVEQRLVPLTELTEFVQ